MNSMETILEWTFIARSDIPKDVSKILASNETAVAAFKTVRDRAIFTNKRLIIRDSQGMTGSKVEMYSIPYASINMWATENAGISLDMSAEVDLWTRAGHFKINLRRGIDVREFDQIIAEAVFGSK